MSARKRRLAAQRRTDYLHLCLERWWRATEIRSEWLSHALSTEPADRERAETAITALYRLVGAERPRFVWVASPSAAAEVLPFAEGPVDPRDALSEWERGFATLAFELRQSLGRGSGSGGVRPSWRPRLASAAAALEAGRSLDEVVDQWVHGSLGRWLVDGLCLPVRRALADRLPGFGWYGQHDAHWIAYGDARRQLGLCRFAPADLEQLDLWAAVARSCGWWWPRRRICVVAERPEAIHTEPVQGSDGELRLHHPRGPALRYRDGWALHAWHGTRVPQWVITDPSVERIHTEPNVEVRRCAIERIGWDGYIEQAGLELVAVADDPGNAGCRLRLYDIPARIWGGQARVLLATNGSVERDGRRRRYGLSVPARFDNPVAAAGWSYGLDADQYAQLLRRT